MSVLRDFRSTKTTRFPGLDDFTEPPNNDGAQVARNVVYQVDRAETRPGFEEYEEFTPTLPQPGGNAIQGIRSLHHWLSATWQRLMMFSKGSDDSTVLPFVTHHNFDIGTREDVVRDLPAATTWTGWAEYGSRIFMYFLNAAGAAASAGRVWNGLFNSALGTPGPIVDTLFQAPLNEGGDFSLATSEPGAGLITAGDHRLGLVFVTRNGYETKAIEITATFTATGDQSLRLTLTPTTTWPLWVDLIKPLMSTVQNPNLLYFIPETSVAPFIGTATPALIDINLSDEELTFATEATDWFSLATENDVGNIKFAGVYGSRMVYISDIADSGTLGRISHIWFSEADDPQRLFADRSIRHLPEKRTAVCGFTLLGTYYVLGPNWTYSFNETTDFPVAWYPPETISDSIGVVAPGCVTQNKSRNFAWVASKSGLYAFEGQQYTIRPASYRQTLEWRRINWAAPPQCFKLVDHAAEQRVEFLCPLDGSTVPTHKMVWSYQVGIALDRVKFSLDNFKLADANVWNPGSMDVVQNPMTLRQEIWMTSERDAKVYRQKNVDDDAEPYNDNGIGIESRYRSKNLCPIQTAPARHAASHVRLQGEGEATVELWGYDGRKRARKRFVDLEKSGSKLRKVGAKGTFVSETAYLEVSNESAANHWWRLGFVEHWWKEEKRQRVNR